jgi:hypothetical protein
MTMCEKCDAAAANVPAEALEGMASQAHELVKLFKMSADMNFAGLSGGDLFQVPIYVAAKALAESLHATFGEGRRKLAAELEAKVLPAYLEMARCFVERQNATKAEGTGGLH